MQNGGGVHSLLFYWRNEGREGSGKMMQEESIVGRITGGFRGNSLSKRRALQPSYRVFLTKNVMICSQVRGLRERSNQFVHGCYLENNGVRGFVEIVQGLTALIGGVTRSL